jgi:hypothetical protein
MYFQHATLGIGLSSDPYESYGQMQIDVNFNGATKTFLYPWAIEQGILQEAEEPVVTVTPTDHVNIDRDELFALLQKYIDDFSAKRNLPFVVDSSIPVVWFGDIEKYQRSQKRVLTIGLNPSKEEFPAPPQMPRFDEIDFGSPNSPEKLYSTLNRYFGVNPYTRWFNKYNTLVDVLDCSYGGIYGTRTNTAIHIDIYSAIATDPTWGVLSDTQRNAIQSTQLFDELFTLLDPDIILISVNNAVFTAHFGDWVPHGATLPFPGGTIKGYAKQGKLLISGTNFGGTPFGGISNENAQNSILQLINS